MVLPVAPSPVAARSPRRAPVDEPPADEPPVGESPAGVLPENRATGTASWVVPGLGRGVDLPAEVSYLAGRYGSDVAGAPLGEQLVGLRRLIDQLEGVFAAGLLDFDAVGGPADEGMGSLAAWVRHRCRLAPGEAAGRVRVARRLDAELPATAAAVGDGALSWRHAAVVERTVEQVPVEHRE